MKEMPSINFGLIIAFLLPGFVALWGISFFADPNKLWLGTVPQMMPSAGGFLLIALASLAVGLLVSAIRWAIVDRIHYWTGIKRHDPDFSKLKDNIEAYIAIIENHYRYYQYYANMFVALLIAYLSYNLAHANLPWYGNRKWLIFIIFLEIFLFLGSRDSLNKTHGRIKQILCSKE